MPVVLIEADAVLSGALAALLGRVFIDAPENKKPSPMGRRRALAESDPPGAYTMRHSRWPPWLRLRPTILTLFNVRKSRRRLPFTPLHPHRSRGEHTLVRSRE